MSVRLRGPAPEAAGRQNPPTYTNRVSGGVFDAGHLMNLPPGPWTWWRPARDLSWTWRRPPVDLAAAPPPGHPAPSPGQGPGAGGAGRGQIRRWPAGSAAQVHRRYTGGTREVHGRYIPGTCPVVCAPRAMPDDRLGRPGRHLPRVPGRTKTAPLSPR